MNWSEEAAKALSKVPFFVRRRVKKRIEEEAASSGADLVTVEHVRRSQKRFLERMESEVKGYQVDTCFGPAGCPNRAVAPNGLAEDLDNRLRRRDLKNFLKERVGGPLRMHHEFRISISDCPNACSRPQIADIGLIGAVQPEIHEGSCTHCGACIDACRENAISVKGGLISIEREKCLLCGQCIRVCPTEALKEGKKGYRIHVGGKLGRHPRLAAELPGTYLLEKIPQVIERCLDHYQLHCRRGERFGEILDPSDLRRLEGE